jgi:hypothetical protein
MANLKPPVNKKADKKGKTGLDPNTIDLEEAINKTKPTAAIEQTPPSSLVLMQIRVPESARNEFKAYASMRSKSMNVLFLEMFEEYKTRNSDA